MAGAGNGVDGVELTGVIADPRVDGIWRPEAGIADRVEGIGSSVPRIAAGVDVGRAVE